MPLTRFLLTWKGKVVEEVVELNAKRITSLGISLAGGDQLQKEASLLSAGAWLRCGRGGGEICLAVVLQCLRPNFH